MPNVVEWTGCQDEGPRRENITRGSTSDLEVGFDGLDDRSARTTMVARKESSIKMGRFKEIGISEARG
jgi:hypothetical protein